MGPVDWKAARSGRKEAVCLFAYRRRSIWHGGFLAREPETAARHPEPSMAPFPTKMVSTGAHQATL